MVSVLTFKRGQPHCDDNALLNALYQTYPHSHLQLVVMDSSSAPSKVWSDRAKAEERGEAPMLALKIVYRWFNTSDGSSKNVFSLGKLRNMAAELALGNVLVNMDDDDMYHPNYICYVVAHMQRFRLQVVIITPHVEVVLNPDGMRTFNEQALYLSGAHAMSFTKAVAQSCRYAELAFAEEHHFILCVKQQYAGEWSYTGMTNGSLGNRFLFTKVVNPMSVTQQRFFLHRKMFNRLQLEDFSYFFKHQSYMYARFHEQTRPPWVPDASATSAVSWPVVTNDWNRFHMLHKDFFNSSHYPFCAGFARVPGQYFKPDENNREIITTQSALKCCEICARLVRTDMLHTENRDRLSDGHCGGFTFEIARKRCVLGFGDGPSFVPDSIFTHEAGARISTCPKCGAGLAPRDDLMW